MSRSLSKGNGGWLTWSLGVSLLGGPVAWAQLTGWGYVPPVGVVAKANVPTIGTGSGSLYVADTGLITATDDDPGLAGTAHGYASSLSGWELKALATASLDQNFRGVSDYPPDWPGAFAASAEATRTGLIGWPVHPLHEPVTLKLQLAYSGTLSLNDPSGLLGALGTDLDLLSRGWVALYPYAPGHIVLDSEIQSAYYGNATISGGVPALDGDWAGNGSVSYSPASITVNVNEQVLLHVRTGEPFTFTVGLGTSINIPDPAGDDGSGAATSQLDFFNTGSFEILGVYDATGTTLLTDATFLEGVPEPVSGAGFATVALLVALCRRHRGKG